MCSESGRTGLFWDAFKQSRNAMVLLDGQRRVVEVSGAFVALSGYPRSALIGRPLRDFLVHGCRHVAGQGLLRDPRGAAPVGART